MNKSEVLIFVFFLVLIIFVKCFFPFFSSFYGVEFRDDSGVFYLASSDPLFYQGLAMRGEWDNLFEWMGYKIYSLLGTIGLFWIPVVFGVFSCVLFYFVLRCFFSFWASFFGSLFFLFHPASFFSSAKGVFDSNFIIQFFEVLIIFVLVGYVKFNGEKGYTWGIFKRGEEFILALVFCSLLSFFWNGWMILFVGVSCIGLMLIFVETKQMCCIWFFMFLLVITNVSIYIYYRGFIGVVTQLQSFVFLSLFDYVLLPVVFVVLLFFVFKCSEGDEKLVYFIFSGFLFFGVLGVFYIKFFYLFVPFLALAVCYVMDNMEVKKALSFGFFFVLFTLLFSNINQPIILVEDSIVDAMKDFDDSEYGVLLGSWDYGNIYFGFSKKQVVCKGDPFCFDKFSEGLSSGGIEYLDELGGEDYMLVLNSGDFEVLGLVFDDLFLDDFFELVGFYDGVVTDVWLFKRVSYVYS